MRIALILLAVSLTAACQKTEDTSAAPKAEAPAEKPKTAQDVKVTAKKAAVEQAAKAPAEKAAWESIPQVTVSELETSIKAGAIVVDANGAKTREKYGVIPGALKIDNYRQYEPAKVLPEDKAKQLVFYCGSEKCTAAPKAAQKAIEAGYKNVTHLKAGIRGWVDAGKKVEKSS